MSSSELWISKELSVEGTYCLSRFLEGDGLIVCLDTKTTLEEMPNSHNKSKCSLKTHLKS